MNPERKDRICPGCLGNGWLLDCNDNTITVKKCHTCNTFSSDEEAQQYVVLMARRITGKAGPREVN